MPDTAAKYETRQLWPNYPGNTLLHTCEVDEASTVLSVLCGRVEPEHIDEVAGVDGGEGGRPTCTTCLRRDPRFPSKPAPTPIESAAVNWPPLVATATSEKFLQRAANAVRGMLADKTPEARAYDDADAKKLGTWVQENLGHHAGLSWSEGIAREFADLKEKNAQMREALGFYAAAGNYKLNLRDMPRGRTQVESSLIEQDKGTVARAALV